MTTLPIEQVPKGIRMVFCGKCGLQLTSGMTACPRCGTPTDPELISEDSQPNSPTIAASSTFGVNQPHAGPQGPISPGPGIPAQQQPLILGPTGINYTAAEQMANEATNMMGSQAPAMPGQIPARTSYQGYAPQGAANYPQQRALYPDYVAQGGPAYQQYGTSSAEAARNRARGRLVALLLILLGLLLVLGAMVLFILTRNPTTSAFSASQQDHLVAQQYFLIAAGAILR
jgi:hypothetical protein